MPVATQYINAVQLELGTVVYDYHDDPQQINRGYPSGSHSCTIAASLLCDLVG